MPAICSFAVLDLETANLPDFNFNKTNITEISIHGFQAKAISNAVNCIHPRITHKLTLLFNPRMMIHPESEKITGLNNDMLEHESAFDKNAGSVIVNFLEHLRKPVCLVAHNGDKFDFPVLKHSFAKLGMELPSDILCLDSLPAIKDLDLAREAEIESEEDIFVPLNAGSDLKVETLTTTSTNLNKENKSMTNDTSVKTEPSLNDENVNELPKTFEHSEQTDSKNDNETQLDWQKFNETTPKRPPNIENSERKRKRLIEDRTPVQIATPPIPNSRKCLFRSPASTNSKKFGNYKLVTIYERLFGYPPENAHHAEADVITLEKIMLGYGKSFVDYAEQNAKPFSEVKKLGAR